MASTAERPFLDRPAARLVAIGIALAAAGALAWINRDAFSSAPSTTSVATSNPDLAACLDERVGAVDAMRRDGVINEQQYGLFRSRAQAYCTARYPTQ
ncbi:hypothetical protein C8N35_10515 [Breoghania corrubedonensis]|uniref:Uncharacterized protein n=1 Tax=Breoghania corrubedonensis TaxID=665038 RepID=A0A2T5V8D4_9HYPH|nr:hypothetical protein [Breoghania corrubedonensis]PTW60015.1 hypothetical protein C8N35_10515 [Breoghania corrubedonensis]